jgi:hypothetical protein
MIQVDIAGLMASMQKAPSFTMPEMNEGTSYLHNQLYTRLANDESVSLSDLDFSAFELDDIQTLTRLHSDVIEKNSYQANSIVGTLRNVAPICKPAAYI